MKIVPPSDFGKFRFKPSFWHCVKKGILGTYDTKNKPDGDNGFYKWHKHDWQYEAEYYREPDVPMRVLF